MRNAEAMLKDTENYSFVGDVIDQLSIGRTAFYRYFPSDRIKELRNEHLTENWNAAKGLCKNREMFILRCAPIA